MVAILEAESTLTERYQTTVPESVRRALRLGKRDKIRFTIRPDGDVVLTRALQTEGEDPVMGLARHRSEFEALLLKQGFTGFLNHDFIIFRCVIW